jgi:nucleotide-binding universal stress UspA family protein
LSILYGPSYANPGELASDYLDNKTVSLSALKKAITQIGFTAERIEVKFVESTKKEPLSKVILKEALNSKCKFLLIGKHNLSKAQEFLFGDTAINIIRKSPIPVIVVTSDEGVDPIA